MWETFIINPMINSMLYIYSILWHNYGLAIIVFTILVKLVTHPLTASQLKSTQKLTELQKSKKWQEIQKKHKGSKEQLSQEQMKLYKEAGVNPFGSCLPLLIQFPIIIGLYQAVIRSLAVTPIQLINLFHHLLPGLSKTPDLFPIMSKFLWMDLSMPERLYLPFLPNYGIPVLAIIVVVTQYLQTKLMTPPPTNPGDQSAQMGKAMNMYMPLMLGYFAYTFASSLSLYFVTSNVVGILQYAVLGKLDWSNIFKKKK